MVKRPLEWDANGVQVEGVPAAGTPFLRTRCPQCGRRFWTEGGYRGHYALEHVLKLRRDYRSGPFDF